MSWHSSVCTVTRLKKNGQSGGREDDGVQVGVVAEKGENMMGRKTSMGQISEWKEMKNNCGQMLGEVAGVCEMARGRVEQLKGGISIVVERRNNIIMFNN